MYPIESMNSLLISMDSVSNMGMLSNIQLSACMRSLFIVNPAVTQLEYIASYMTTLRAWLQLLCGLVVAALVTISWVGATHFIKMTYYGGQMPQLPNSTNSILEVLHQVGHRVETVSLAEQAGVSRKTHPHPHSVVSGASAAIPSRLTRHQEEV